MDLEKKNISHEQQSMLSARKAARLLKCAPDYIGKLCREGKLEGVRTKNAWFVSKESIKRFEDARGLAKAQRSSSLAHIRRQEIETYRQQQGTSFIATSRKTVPHEQQSMLSARKAARLLKCAPDYIGKLCREGKLEGVRTKNAWFVSKESIKRFEDARGLAKAQRSSSLAQTRREENKNFLKQNGIPIIPKHVLNTLSSGALAFGVALVLLLGIFFSADAAPGSFLQKSLSAAVGELDSPFFGTAPLQVTLSSNAFTIPSLMSSLASAKNFFSDFFAYLANQNTPVALGPSVQEVPISQQSPVVLPVVSPLQQTTPTQVPQPSSATPNPTIIEHNTYPVIERIVTHTQSGITQDELTTQLQALATSLRQEIYANAASTPGVIYSGGGFTNAIALTSKIDNLSNVTLSNITVSGLNLLTDLTAPNLSVTGNTTLSGALQVNGTSTLATTTTTGATYLATNNGNVGIATTTPQSTLAVSGNQSIGADYNTAAPTNGLIVEGNVGIGTTSPFSTLSVAGNGYFSGNLTAANITATGTTNLITASTSQLSVFNRAYFGGTATSTFDALGDLALSGTFSQTPAARTASSSSAAPFLFTGALDTGLVGEAPDVQFNDAQTKTFANSTIPLQRAFLINAPTEAFTSYAPSNNFTNLSTFAITGAPITALNGTTTNAHTLYLGASALNASTTNSYGLTAYANTGAQNNYAAEFLGGNVGIGTTSPFSTLSVAGNGYFSGNVTATNVIATGTLAVSGLTSLTNASTTQLTVSNSAWLATAGGNVGIGTTSQQSELAVAGNQSIGADYNTAAPTNGLIVEGNVGVGTTSPATTLAISGSGYFTGGIGAGIVDTNTGEISATNNILQLNSSGTIHSLGTVQANGGSAFGILSTGAPIAAWNSHAFNGYSDGGTTQTLQLSSGSGNSYFNGGGNVGIGTTSPFSTLSVAGNGYLSGDITTAGNATLGTNSANTLTVNSLIDSTLQPNQNITYDIGSPSYYWRNGYFNNLDVNSISAASTSISGTVSPTFTINSGNTTADTENASLIFFRGTVNPNAVLTWNSTAKRFELNQPVFIQNQSTSTGNVTTLSLAGLAGQTADLFNVASSSGAVDLNVSASGNVGVGTTSPFSTLSVAGNGYFSGNVTATNVIATGTLAVNGLASLNGGYVSTGSSTEVGNATTTGTQGVGSLFINNSLFSNLLGTGLSDTAGVLNSVWTQSGNNIYNNNTQNVGIGTTSPFSTLSVAGNGYFSGNVTATNVIATGTLAVSGLTSLTNASTTQLTVSNSAWLATAGGNVGIGTATPSNKLTVAGAIDFSASTFNGSLPGIWSPSGSDIGLVTSGVTQMRVDSSGRLLVGYSADQGGGQKLQVNSGAYINGNVGIGVTNPNMRLTVSGATGPIANFSDGVDTVLLGTSGSTNAYVFGNNKLQLGGNNTVAMTLDTTGNVGVGTTSPFSTLSVAGNGYFSGNVTATNITATGTLNIAGQTTLTNASTTQLTVSNSAWLATAGGNVGIGTATPSNKLTVAGAIDFSASTFNGSLPGIWSPSGSDIGLVTSGVTQMRVDSSGRLLVGYSADQGGGQKLQVNSGAYINGNVGIGVTNPNMRLTVSGATGPIANFSDGVDTVLLGTSGSTNAYVFGNNKLQLGGNNTVAMTLDTTGNVGVGTTSPFSTLSVAGNGYFSGNVTATNITATGTLNIAGQTTLTNASTTQLTVSNSAWLATAGGRVGVGTTSQQSELAVAGNQSIGADYNTAAPTNGLIVEGNVGIGNTSPAQKLDVAGNINTSAGSAYLYNNANVIIASTTLYDYFFGGAGNLTMTGNYNTANGQAALLSNTSGNSNTANGVSALLSNTTGNSNTANGANALQSNTSGNYNTANGQAALLSNTTGTGNTANGTNVLRSNTTGNYNTANGLQALYSNSTGSWNISSGVNAGYGLTTGSDNTLLGSSPDAVSYNQVTSGNQNIAIGYDVAVPSQTASGQLDIGNEIYGTGLTGTGATVSTGNIGIGTVTPLTKLDVAGNIGISGTQIVDASRNLTNIGTISSGAITSSGALTLGTNTITSGLINGQTISSAANFTGSVTVAGNTTLQGTANSVGTITSGIWNGSPITVPYGGTGDTSLTQNGVLFGAGTGAVQATGQGGANTVLVANNGSPSFSSAITVGTSVTTPIVNATTAYELNGSNLNTAGTLSNVAYLNQANVFSALQQFNANASTTELTTTGSTYLATAGGNVGIGTTNPATTLTVNGVARFERGDSIQFADLPSSNIRNLASFLTTADTIQFGGSDNGGSAPINFAFTPNGGGVGIGTTNPLSKLDVNGGAAIGSYAGVNAAPSNGLIVSGSVGIGTTTPLSTLAVAGNQSIGADYNIAAPTNGLIVEGNVGIGTASPGYSLDVLGSSGVRFGEGPTSGGNLTIGGDGTTDNKIYIEAFSNNMAASASELDLTGRYGGVMPLFNVQAATTYFNGNVGIGTTNPLSKLDVNGGAAIGSYAGVTAAPSNGLIVSGTVSIGGTSPAVTTDGLSIQNGGLDIQNNNGGSVSKLFLAGSDQNHYIYSTGSSGNNMYFGEYGANFHFYDTASNVDIMTIKGNSVGIGTTTPNALLDVYGGSAGGGAINGYTRLIVEASDYAVETLKSPAANFSQLLFTDPTAVSLGSINYFNSSNATPNAMTFNTAGAERMRITNTGNVGIGTTNPLSKLDVNGGAAIGSYAGVTAAPSNGLIVSGNVGIGKTNPVSPLDVLGFAGGVPSLSADTGAIGTFTSPTTVQLQFGALGGSPYSAWIQSKVDGQNASYPLALQPAGGNVGIGTTNPTQMLSVGSGSPFTVTSAGAVTDTGETVNGAIGSYANASGDGLLLYGRSSDSFVWGPLAIQNNGSTYEGGLAWGTGGLNIDIGSSLATAMTLLNNGNVGIGQTSPAAKLDVNGTLGFQTQLVGNGKDIADTGDSYLRLNQSSAFTSGIWLGSSALRMDGAPLDVGSQGGAGEVEISGTNGTGLTGITINGNSGANSYFNTGGDFGIGTASPVYKLDVNGSLHSSGAATIDGNFNNTGIFATTNNGANANFIKFGANAGGDFYNWYINSQTNGSGVGTRTLQLWYYPYDSNPSCCTNILDFNGAGTMQWSSTYQWNFGGGATFPGSGIWNTSGNVGIGTASPGSNVLEVLRNGGTGGTQLADLTSNDTWGSTLQISNTSSGGGSFQLDVPGSSNSYLPVGSFAIYDQTHSAARLAIGSGGNIGIGTTTPLSTLAVAGNQSIGADYNIAAPTNGLIVEGNVGIGTASPGYSLDVLGSSGVRFGEGPTSGGNLTIGGDGTTDNKIYIEAFSNNMAASASELDLTGRYGGVMPLFNVQAATTYFNGNVGIGTTNPLSKLDVNGGAAIGSYAGVTAAPSNGLIVSGTVSIGGTSPAVTTDGLSIQNGGLDIQNNNGGSVSKLFLAGSDQNHYIYSTGSSGNNMYFGEYGANFHFYDTASNVDIMTIKGNSVGIGTTTPNALLDVYGGSAGGGAINGYTRLIVEASDYAVETLKSPAANFSQLLFTDPTAVSLGSINYFNSSNATPNAMTFNTAGAERMRITNTGNVGIGTTNPLSKLDVNGGAAVGSYAGVNAAPTNGLIVSGNVGIGTVNPTSNLYVSGGNGSPSLSSDTGSLATFYSNTTVGMQFGAISGGSYGTWIQSKDDSQNLAYPLLLNPAGGDVQIGAATGDVHIGGPGVAPNLVFDNNATIKGLTGQTITLGAGSDIFNVAVKLGIGSSTPWRALSVNGTAAMTGLTNSAGGSALCISAAGDILNSGGTSCTGSSIQYKENVQTLTPGFALNELGQLQVVSFDYKPGDYSPWNSPHSYGMVAQQVQQVDPNLISFDSNGQPFSLQFEKITGLEVQAIQELNADIQVIASSTASSTPESQTFAQHFWSSVTGHITTWLADTGNGIADLFVQTLHAQNVYANTVTANTLCLGNVCITKDQLQALLNGSTLSGTSTTSTTSPVVTLNGSNPALLTVGDTYVDLGATVTDGVDHNLGYSVSVDGGATTTPSDISINTTVAGTHTILYIATDSAGNVGTATRTVIVQALTATSTTSSTATSTTSTTATSTTSTITTSSTATSTTATSTPITSTTATSTTATSTTL